MLTTSSSSCVCAEGEHFEMGGIIDPERGALIYRQTTQVEKVHPEEGSDFRHKKIKRITSETSWIGTGAGTTQKQPFLDEDAIEPWHDDEVEQNPLYSTSDYVSDFHNPLYARRLSAAEGATIAATGIVERDDMQLLTPSGGRAARGRPGSEDSGGQEYVDYLSADPGLDNADTLF